MGMGFDNTCAVSGKWNASKVIPRLYGWVYKTLRLSPLVVEYSVVVMSTRLNLMGSQFSIPVLWNLCSVFRISGGINCWDPVQDSDTGGPSSITVRMEYLFAFQYWYWELCVENRWGRNLQTHHVDSTLKRSFPRRFNVESTWCVCREALLC